MGDGGYSLRGKNVVEHLQLKANSSDLVGEPGTVSGILDLEELLVLEEILEHLLLASIQSSNPESRLDQVPVAEDLLECRVGHLRHHGVLGQHLPSVIMMPGRG